MVASGPIVTSGNTMNHTGVDGRSIWKPDSATLLNHAPAGPILDFDELDGMDAGHAHHAPALANGHVVQSKPGLIAQTLQWLNPFALAWFVLQLVWRACMLPFTWWMSFLQPDQKKAAGQPPAAIEVNRTQNHHDQDPALLLKQGTANHLVERLQTKQEEVSRLSRQLQDARKAEADLHDQLHEREYQLEQLNRRNKELQHKCDDATKRADYARVLGQEVQLLEGQLAEANRHSAQLQMDLDTCNAALDAFLPQTPETTEVTDFEIGFGSIEQSHLLDSLAVHAESLASTIMSDWNHFKGAPGFIHNHAKQSVEAYWLYNGGATSTTEDRLATRTALQQALMEVALSHAHLFEEVAVTQSSLAVMSFVQQFVLPKDQEAIYAALQHLRAQISRSVYLAGARMLQPTGAAGKEITPQEGELAAAHNKVVDDMARALQLDAKQAAQMHGHLMGLVQAAMQVVLLCRSLQASVPGCIVICGGHAGLNWDPTIMEPPLKEVPAADLDRSVVLACVRPSLHYQTSPDAYPVVLVKAQVVTLVPRGGQESTSQAAGSSSAGSGSSPKKGEASGSSTSGFGGPSGTSPSGTSRTSGPSGTSGTSGFSASQQLQGGAVARTHSVVSIEGGIGQVLASSGSS